MKYEIIGGNLPAALCKLDQGETVICQRGAMSWMDDGIEMQTEGGGLGKMFGRALTGESMFLNRYVANRAGEIAFASSFPGEIRGIEVTPQHSVIAQKRSFLASDEGVEVSVYAQTKIGKGLLGGEGFLMQKFSGNGTVLIEIDGAAQEYVLQAGERKIIDTGYLVMMDDTCSMDIERVKGAKNALLGGEGFFNTVISGPGRIILQTIPASKMASELYRFMPKSN